MKMTRCDGCHQDIFLNQVYFAAINGRDYCLECGVERGFDIADADPNIHFVIPSPKPKITMTDDEWLNEYRDQEEDSHMED